MTDFFDELEQQLHDTARAGTSATPNPPWWRRRRTLGVLALVTLVGAGTPAVARVTGVWAPSRDQPRQPARTVTADTPSGPSAGRRLPAFTCAGDFGPGRTRISYAPAAPALLAAFGVLRAPATPSDRVAPATLERLRVGRVNPSTIRRLGTAGGETYYAIPSRGAPSAPSAECLDRLSEADRREVVRVSAERRRQLSRPHLCVQTRSGGSCGATVEQAVAAGTTGSSGNESRSTHWGVVPDGVAAVSVSFGDDSRTFTVRRNFYSFQVVRGADEPPTRVTWHMTDGTTRPAPGLKGPE